MIPGKKLPDGSLLVTTTLADENSRFVGGVAVSPVGAVHVTSLLPVQVHPNGLGTRNTGELCIRYGFDLANATWQQGLPFDYTGHLCCQLNQPAYGPNEIAFSDPQQPAYVQESPEGTFTTLVSDPNSLFNNRVDFFLAAPISDGTIFRLSWTVVVGGNYRIFANAVGDGYLDMGFLHPGDYSVEVGSLSNGFYILSTTQGSVFNNVQAQKKLTFGDVFVGGVRVGPLGGVYVTDVTPPDVSAFSSGFDGGFS